MERLPVATCLTALLSLLLSAPGLLPWGAGGGPPGGSPSAFSLRPEAVREGQVHRLVTYAFAYGDPISLVCGAVIIWYFSGSFEKTVGTAKHCFLTLAFTVSLALLYLLLRAIFSGRFEAADAEGFTPVAFAMLGASIARSRMRRTMFFGLNLHVALVPWLLLAVSWFIPSSSFLGNVCGLLIGDIYGYGYCFGVDLPESTATRLDHKFLFRLLKRLPGLKYIPGSLAERRASQTKKLNPVPGSYPTQNYHTSPHPASVVVPTQHPNVHTPKPGPLCTPGPMLHQTPAAFGASCAENHFHAPPGSSSASQHLSRSDWWTARRTDGCGAHQAPGFLVAGAASESAELCQVHVS